MALMPGFDTRSAAAVAGQVAQERLQERAQNIQQEQFEAGLIQRDQELALQAFQAQQNFQIRRAEQQRLAEQSLREAGMRHLRLAVDTGIKFDPASKQYRPLTENDAEFSRWREVQAERKARLPLSPDAQVNLAREKTKAVAEAQEPFRVKAEERLVGREKRAETRVIDAEKRNVERVRENRVYQAKEWERRFNVQRKAQGERDLRIATANLDRLKAQDKMTKDAIKLRHKLAEPERKAKRQDIKESKAERARQSAYFRANAAVERSAQNLVAAQKAKLAAEKQLWPEFRKSYLVPDWIFDNTPTRQDVDVGGALHKEWQRFMAPYNVQIARAQGQLKKNEAAVNLARDAYLLGVTPQKAELPERPSQEVMDQLIQKHKGDWKAAQAEWDKRRKAQ